MKIQNLSSCEQPVCAVQKLGTARCAVDSVDNLLGLSTTNKHFFYWESRVIHSAPRSMKERMI